MALPYNYLPKVASKLVRLGRDNDGGYLVDQQSIDRADLLVSFGIDTDCSFEHDFWQKKPECPCVAFDHTTSWSLFAKRFVRKLTCPFPPWRLRHFAVLKSILDERRLYRYFFGQPTNEHRCQAIGYATRGCVDVNMIVNEFSSINILFKIDIEGSEYRILDQILAVQERICGLLIEFHDCDLHRDRISRFIRDFKLPLVHIHANNCGPLDQHGDPISLEMTFGSPSSSEHTLSQPWQSSVLDQPNTTCNADYVLQFESS